MTIYFSPSTNGFYDSRINGKNIPEDAAEISKEDHAALINGQFRGQEIFCNEKGRPALRDRVVSPEDNNTPVAKPDIDKETIALLRQYVFADESEKESIKFSLMELETGIKATPPNKK